MLDWLESQFPHWIIDEYISLVIWLSFRSVLNVLLTNLRINVIHESPYSLQVVQVLSDVHLDLLGIAQMILLGSVDRSCPLVFDQRLELQLVLAEFLMRFLSPWNYRSFVVWVLHGFIQFYLLDVSHFLVDDPRLRKSFSSLLLLELKKVFIEQIVSAKGVSRWTSWRMLRSVLKCMEQINFHRLFKSVFNVLSIIHSSFHFQLHFDLLRSLRTCYSRNII